MRQQGNRGFPHNVFSFFSQAPQTGIYVFYLAGDDECAVYLSTNDKPENKKRIILLPNGRHTTKEQWDKYV